MMTDKAVLDRIAALEERLDLQRDEIKRLQGTVRALTLLFKRHRHRVSQHQDENYHWHVSLPVHQRGDLEEKADG